ncbi:MAG: guanine deaminase [Polyangiaceae bacterium]
MAHPSEVTSNARFGFRAAILTSTSSGELVFFEDGLLAVDAAGRITHLEAVHTAGPDRWLDVLARVSRGGPLTVRDLRGRLVVPGFVDTHVHFPQTRVIGSASGPLLEWLEHTVFPEEARFHDARYAGEVALEFIERTASAGTTAAGVYSSSSVTATEALCDALDDADARAVVGLVLMDENCPDALRVPGDRALAGLRRLVERYHGRDGRLDMAVMPRFALSCSRTLMTDAAALAAELDLPIHTHVAENPREGAAVLAMHPYADDYLGVYDKVGLMGRRTVLAHAVHLSGAEWDRVASSGAAIAHCPDSNAFLGSGRMHLAEARARGIPVGLGSDVAAGRSFDIRRAAAHAYDASLSFGAPVEPAYLFHLATLGGARVLGLDARVGSLEVGKDADFVVLAPPAWAIGREHALRAATFASDTAPVLETFVRGRCVFRAPNSAWQAPR